LRRYMMLNDSAQNAALMEHHIKGRAMLPGAAGVAMMVAVARTLATARGADNSQLAHVVFQKPVFLDLGPRVGHCGLTQC